MKSKVNYLITLFKDEDNDSTIASFMKQGYKEKKALHIAPSKRYYLGNFLYHFTIHKLTTLNDIFCISL